MKLLQNLNSRERLLILVGIPLVLLVTFYLYLWEPLYQDRSRLRVDLPEKEATLAWMRHKLSDRNLVAAGSPQVDTRPLLTVIEKLAISARIQNSIQRVQPGNNGTVEIWFQEVVADRLFQWIDQLSLRGIFIESATITRGSPGLVAARIKLGR
ncbi:MAG: type II secretion system protein M [Acidiferrobacterales bacterium]|nr:type II secretion system protein M [Acidiferrobacterales bacterium]